MLVVSGPSGVGKGAMIDELMSRLPQLEKSISCTTRQPRPDETDGQQYHFIRRDQFRQMQRNGELLEWATVHRDILYGTPKAHVEEALDSGTDLILEVDYQGARSVRQKLPARSVLVFIMPPSWQELKNRLRGRETESEDDVNKRLTTAHRELQHVDFFQYAVVNDDLQQATDELEAILVTEHRHASRNDYRTMAQHLLPQAEAERS